ncbi:hypothetical protein WMF39_17370 [Sorangium sp. So ce1504]|uniref:hypothetical protein n=1 Tax=Sorangium sp. So ce1504 TaxID=3133337 RepID=UPI003F6270DE
MSTLGVELLGTMLDPEDDRSLATARDLTRQAEALLGDTAEDCMSRALAAAARRVLARRLATDQALPLARSARGPGPSRRDPAQRSCQLSLR